MKKEKTLIASIHWPSATPAQLEDFAAKCDARAAVLFSKPGHMLAAQIRTDIATQARRMT